MSHTRHSDWISSAGVAYPACASTATIARDRSVTARFPFTNSSRGSSSTSSHAVRSKSAITESGALLEDHNFKPFRGNAHSSLRFGLSARTAPALTRRLPFAPGCVLRLCLLDSKAVIFASHKLHFAWRTIGFSNGVGQIRKCEVGRPMAPPMSQ